MPSSRPALRKFLRNRKSSTRFGYWISWWARVDVASRAAKNSPPGYFCAVFCDSAAAVRIRPLSPEKVSTKQKIQHPVRMLDLLVGAGGVASRASKKAPLGLFCPPDCTAGRCCSNPPAFVSFMHIQNKKLQRSSYAEAFFGGAKQPKSEPLPSGASLAAISSKVMVFVPSL